MKQPDFIFFDVEALGPPGHGQIFALGAVRFAPVAGQILNRWSRRVKLGDGANAQIRGTRDTLDWLLQQSPEVIAQLRDPKAASFERAYFDFMSFIGGPEFYGGPVYLCADDWSDFAWIEFEAMRAALGGLRRSELRLYDMGFLDHVARARTIKPERPLVEHIALDDAEAGAIRLMERWPNLTPHLPFHP